MESNRVLFMAQLVSCFLTSSQKVIKTPQKADDWTDYCWEVQSLYGILFLKSLKRLEAISKKYWTKKNSKKH